MNCPYGNLVRDENTYQDNECRECLYERSSAEGWTNYGGGENGL